jgi:hypothetical protein
MKTMAVLLMILPLHMAFAGDITITPGSSIQMGDTRVICSGASQPTGGRWDAYLNLPNSELINILKTSSVGACKIRLVGSYDFFYSPRYVNGVYLSSNMHPQGIGGFVKSAIRNGDCD